MDIEDGTLTLQELRTTWLSLLQERKVAADDAVSGLVEEQLAAEQKHTEALRALEEEKLNIQRQFDKDVEQLKRRAAIADGCARRLEGYMASVEPFTAGLESNKRLSLKRKRQFERLCELFPDEARLAERVHYVRK